MIHRSWLIVAVVSATLIALVIFQRARGRTKRKTLAQAVAKANPRTSIPSANHFDDFNPDPNAVGAPPTATPFGGVQIVKRLRRKEQISFHQLTVRLIRVKDGDPNDPNDDAIELSLKLGSRSSQVSIGEHSTKVFQGYAITAQDVIPTRGEGTAKIKIRIVGTKENQPVS